MIRYPQDDSRVTFPHLDPGHVETLSQIEYNLEMAQRNVWGHRLWEIEKILNQCCAIDIDEVEHDQIGDTFQDMFNYLFEKGYEYSGARRQITSNRR